MATPTSIGTDESRPVLTIGLFEWAIPRVWWPRDLHRTAVYANGDVVHIEADSDLDVVMLRTNVDASRLRAWLDLADTAGLTAPGRLPPETLPDPGSVVDGAFAVVTRRHGDELAVVAIDQPGVGVTGGERRAVLDALLLAIRRDAPEPVAQPVERWAVETTGPTPDLATLTWPWPELDPRSLPWTTSAGGIRCAIVTRAGWPYTTTEAADLGALTSGIFRRPLLPHETSCADVFAWRDLLGLGETVSLVDPDLR